MENPPELRGIDVTTTGGFTFRNPRRLLLPTDSLMYLGFRDYDFTAKGDKFVIIVPEKKETKNNAAAPAPRIDVVLNWFEELKARIQAP